MVSAPSAQELALACGVAGAYVDVTDDLVTDSVKGSWGRTSAFSDTRPGVFSFDLVNDDGKYTPGNASTTLDTPVRVGMGVSHIIDGMQFAGTIRSTQPYFTGPDGLSGSSKLRVTCDDMLGNVGRRRINGSLADATFEAGFPFLLWKLDEESGSDFAESWLGGSGPPMRAGINPDVHAGIKVSHIPPGGQSVVGLTSDVAFGSFIASDAFPEFDYGDETLGAFGFWFEQASTTADLNIAWKHLGLAEYITVAAGHPSGVPKVALQAGFGSVVFSSALTADAGHFVAVSTSTTFSAGAWTIKANLYVDGVYQGQSTYAQTGSVTVLTKAARRLTRVRASVGSPGSGYTYLSRLSHTLNPINETYIREGTADVRILAIANVAPEVVLDTLPTMSSAPFGLNDTTGQSALDALNDVTRTEQGYVWAETSGTLTSPSQKIRVRARDRDLSDAIDAAHTFSVSEILNAPEFATDIESMVSTTEVRGPNTSVVVQDPALVPYVGSASDSAAVLLRDAVDITAWGEDRLLRGAATDVRLPQISLDALAIDRWSDISSLRPGDRVRITDLPLAQLGVDHVDGWLLGSSYNIRYPSLHGDDQILFTFYFQPALADTGIYDTNYWMAGGSLTLSSAISTAGATSMSVSTSGPKLETSAVPYDLMIDDERVTVTACTGATPQVATITRGVGGTTATTHSTSAVIEVPAPSLYAF